MSGDGVNGTITDNALHNLFSLTTIRQWRTTTVHYMSKEFMYAVAAPDLVEGARRLGNIFHTLSDAFAPPHVVRKAPVGPGPDLDQPFKVLHDYCSLLHVTTPISMDVVSWPKHVQGDQLENKLFNCAVFFGALSVQSFVEARAVPVKDAKAVNAAIDKLVRDVLCPALSVDAEFLDKPSGGATAEWSSDSSLVRTGWQIMPEGLVDASEAESIIAQWNSELATMRNSTNKREIVPSSIFVAKRDVDVCATPEAVHVSEADVEKLFAPKGIPPNYIVPV